MKSRNNTSTAATMPQGRSQRYSSFGISTSSVRPRQRCPRDITLATSPGTTGEFHTFTDGISCLAWHGDGVFESARSGIRPARSSPSPVIICTRAVRSVISSDNQLAVAHFLLQPQLSGTLCLSMSSHHHLLQPFANGRRHSCFNSHFRTS